MELWTNRIDNRSRDERSKVIKNNEKKKFLSFRFGVFVMAQRLPLQPLHLELVFFFLSSNLYQNKPPTLPADKRRKDRLLSEIPRCRRLLLYSNFPRPPATKNNKQANYTQQNLKTFLQSNQLPESLLPFLSFFQTWSW